MSSNPSYSSIDYRVEDHILTLTLNRPDQLNAFTVEMADELEHAFRRASEDDDVRAIVVTGAGRAFCAGMDLSVGGNVFGLDETQRPTVADMHERLTDTAIQRGVRDTGGRVTLAIYDCKKPVIGAINGAAVGIGATMTLAMDIRLASEKARIGFVFGKIGVVPEACSSWFLPRIVGIQQALEWCYTGRVFDAAEAKAGGRPWDMAKGFDHSAVLSPIRPVAAVGHPASARIWPSKSCTSSKLALQCSLPWPVPRRPCRLMVRRRPSPRWVKSQTMPSSPPSAWQLAQDM